MDLNLIRNQHMELHSMCVCIGLRNLNLGMSLTHQRIQNENWDLKLHLNLKLIWNMPTYLKLDLTLIGLKLHVHLDLNLHLDLNHIEWKPGHPENIEETSRRAPVRKHPQDIREATVTYKKASWITCVSFRKEENPRLVRLQEKIHFDFFCVPKELGPNEPLQNEIRLHSQSKVWKSLDIVSLSLACLKMLDLHPCVKGALLQYI